MKTTHDDVEAEMTAVRKSLNTLSDRRKSAPGAQIYSPHADRHRGPLRRRRLWRSKFNCNSTRTSVSQLLKTPASTQTRPQLSCTWIHTNTCKEAVLSLSPDTGGLKGGSWLANHLLIQLNNNQCLCIPGDEDSSLPRSRLWSPLYTLSSSGR